MGDITISGDGLGILLICKHIPIHHWMAFASWYSLSKKLPDAKVVVSCDVDKAKWNLFGWIYRAKVKFIKNTSPNLDELFPDSATKISISPYVMAVREYNPTSFEKVPAKSEEMATLVDCEGGCGKFVVEKWIDKLQPPFVRAVKLFSKENMTTNEIKVLQLWEQCNWLYSTM